MRSPHTVDANWIGRAFADDRDLRLPERPRLIPELLVLPVGADGLLFVGAEEEQVIRGRSARGALRSLLPELDGRRTLAELAQALPLSATQLTGMVSLLFSRGLLEDGQE